MGREFVALVALILSLAAIALSVRSSSLVNAAADEGIDLRARVETLEKGQLGLDSFMAELRTRTINIELLQNYAADSYEEILQALHVEPKKRPLRQPHEWPKPVDRALAPTPPPPPLEEAPPAPPQPQPLPAPAPEPWWKIW